jgi:peptidoglycan/xylan/chitin deacetylase (PgdA/CDA1 family)
MTEQEFEKTALQRCVTISVDDGATNDLKTADLLHKHGLPATFYIPARNPERPVLEPPQIRGLAQVFEIGSHTLNHTPLKWISDEEASREIRHGKDWLENTIGSSAISFCYPRGKFNGKTPSLVKSAGFLGARTQMLNLHDFPKNPFLWGVSTHAWSHSKAVQVRHALLEWNFVGMVNFFREYKATTEWHKHFTRVLERVVEDGGIAHLALHSWEIDELNEWQKLESIFSSISHCGVPVVTNGDLYRAWYPLGDPKLVAAAARNPA